MGEVRQPTYQVTDPETGKKLTKVSKIWWIRYYRDGKRFEESSKSTKKTVAIKLLQQREGKIADGVPVTPTLYRFTFNQAAADFLNDYTANQKRSLVVAKRRVEKHLEPYFGGRRLATITTADVRAYIAHRQQQGIVNRKGERVGDVSNGEINRELQHLKRIFTLAVQAEKIIRRPHIPLLREASPRAGFFEREQFEAVRDHLPAEIRPIVSFAFITGWRVQSEILPLQWHQVNFEAETVTLPPGSTKNREARVFPFTADLRTLLEERKAEADALKKAGHIVPWVFWRMVAKGRRGPKTPKPVQVFTVAWKNACRAAGCPGRIPHDLRRTSIRNLVRAGIPERVAMQMSGHLTRSTFERYNIVSPTDLREAAAKATAYAEAERQGKKRESGTRKGRTGSQNRSIS